MSGMVVLREVGIGEVSVGGCRGRGGKTSEGGVWGVRRGEEWRGVVRRGKER